MLSWSCLAACVASCATPGTRGPDPRTTARATREGGAAAGANPVNPFKGERLWVDPDSKARGFARRVAAERPEDAALLRKLSEQPQAIWVGGWIGEPEAWMRRQMNRTAGKGFLPVFVVYNIPLRDCGHHSKGGADGAPAYRAWIDALAAGIGPRKAVVILEPDGLPLLDKCLTPAQQVERLSMIRHAVARFGAQGGTSVYLDAGHSDWVPAAKMAARLRDAGIEKAAGFSLNVSNYKRNDALIAYGRQVSAGVGGKPFIIDTSRNGNGPPDTAGDASWCNPDGRALGPAPTAETGDALVHAYLWIKTPGESDGECNGGPKAGTFWPEQAIGLARRAGL
jgi:endoglucanase